jgi:nucleoid-associated protein YgaU
MTRETKIGLLVGLAFIIVIGILLSDHMTSTNQPQQALLSEAAANVRESVTPPAPSQSAPPPVTAVRQITPAAPVPTRAELQPPPPPPVVTGPVVEDVRIGGPAAAGAASGAPVGPIVIRQSDGPVVRAEPQPQPQPLTDVVPAGETASAPPSAGGEDSATVELDQWATAPRPPVVPVQPPAPAARASSTDRREFVAQAGDNLSKLATRMLGANTKANRDAIVRANPSLQRNPNLVVEGRKYKVPGASQAPTPAAPAPVVTTAAGTSAIPETVPVPQRRASAPIPVTDLVDPVPPSRPADQTVWYVVKENDNLWRIAAEQLGSGNAAAQIKAMNKDVLKGGDSIVPNMRLRLPAKRVASAAD